MTVRKGMNLTEVPIDEVVRYLQDPVWVMEQKHDGTRGLAVLTTGYGHEMLQRGGGVLKHSAAVQWLPDIWKGLRTVVGNTPGEVVLDGEIMIDTGEYRVFDLPYLRYGGLELVRPDDSFFTRRKALEALRFEGPVSLVRQAVTPHEKRTMLDAAQKAGVEGVVLKAIHGTYEPGVRSKTMLKAKFTKTADVVVMEVTRGRNEAGREVGSILFGVVRGLTVEALGRCSVIGKPEVKPMDVIEVAYLYRLEGGALVQPRMVRVREDKTVDQCRDDQFPVYSRRAL